MMPSPSGSADAQPSLGSGGKPSSFSLGHRSASPMIPSPSGSVDLQPSFGSGGRPSSFSLRHLSVPSSGMPSPSASTTTGGALGSGGRQTTDSYAQDAAEKTKTSRSAASRPPTNHLAIWVTMDGRLSVRFVGKPNGTNVTFQLSARYTAIPSLGKESAMSSIHQEV